MYTQAVADEICRRLSEGETLRQICRDEDMPAHSTVLHWAIGQSGAPTEFVEQYARARTMCLDVIAEQIVEIADIPREGVKTERKEVGRQCSVCLKDVRWRSRGWIHSIEGDELCEEAEALKVEETKTVTGDMVERARLQVDARKWLLSKLRPEKYGDRTTHEHGGVGGGPVTIILEGVDPKPHGNPGTDT